MRVSLQGMEVLESLLLMVLDLSSKSYSGS